MLNPNRTGIVIGALIGGWHVVWSILIIVGSAQSILDFIFWAHMIQSIYVVKTFDSMAAFTLILVTSAIGYLFGYAGAIFWNKLHRTPST